MHAARTLVVTTLLVAIAVTVVAGGATATSTSPTADVSRNATPDDGRAPGVVPSEDADAIDSTTLGRQDESDVNVTVVVAPGAALESMLRATSPEEYGPDANLSARPRVTLSDTLVLRIRSSGLGAAVRSQPGNSTTGQFVSLVESDNANLTISELETVDEIPTAIDPTDTAAINVVQVDDNTYDLVVDLSTVDATVDENGNQQADDDEQIPVETGDTYQINFTFDGTSSQRIYGVFPVAVIFNPNQPGNNPIFLPGPGQALRAETTLAPGTRLSVELTAEGDDVVQFEEETTVRNVSRSQFEAIFNLTAAPDGVDTSIVVKNDGEVIGATTGEIARLRAAVTLPERTDQRDTLPVDRVEFSQGGFLIVRDGGPNGPIVANRYLDAGNYTDLSVLLTRDPEADTLSVTAYADIDGDRVFDNGGPDRPYRIDGEPVGGTIRLPGATPTPTLTETVSGVTNTPTTRSDPETATVTETPTARLVTEPPTRTTARITTRPRATQTTTAPFTPYTLTSSPGPGFGVVAALVAIVVLVALVAGRR